jgi:hypothetical protein
MKEGTIVLCKWGEEEIPTQGTISAVSNQSGPTGVSVTLYEVTTDLGRDWFEPHELIDCAEMDAAYDEMAALREDEADLIGQATERAGRK